MSPHDRTSGPLRHRIGDNVDLALFFGTSVSPQTPSAVEPRAAAIAPASAPAAKILETAATEIGGINPTVEAPEIARLALGLIANAPLSEVPSERRAVTKGFRALGRIAGWEEGDLRPRNERPGYRELYESVSDLRTLGGLNSASSSPQVRPRARPPAPVRHPRPLTVPEAALPIPQPGARRSSGALTKEAGRARSLLREHLAAERPLAPDSARLHLLLAGVVAEAMTEGPDRGQRVQAAVDAMVGPDGIPSTTAALDLNAWMRLRSRMATVATGLADPGSNAEPLVVRTQSVVQQYVDYRMAAKERGL